MVNEGDEAPDFELPSTSGNWRLSDHLNRFIILYFYPKDDTPGCTAEACGFRDVMSELRKLDAEVVGVSVDSLKSHEKFASKYGLNFTLLSDEEGKVARLYGAYDDERRRALRKTYIIAPDGKLIKIYNKVMPDKHAEEVVRLISELTKKER